MLICRLEEILNERGLKKGWLANRVGISPATISNWINKGVVPELEVAYRIAEELDLRVEEIWQRKKPMS